MTVFPIDEENTDVDLPNAEERKSAEADAIAEAVQQACADDPSSAEEPSDIEAALAAEKDRLLRLRAEMENLRGRTAREINDERRYAPLQVVRDLLPVVDNIDRAIEAATKQIEAAQIETAEQTDETGSLMEGFKLVRQQLMTVLQQHNCQPIEAVGQLFDPQIHQAILQQPSDEQPANYVLQETQTGYQLHDRVVRASQVIISTGPADA